MIATPAIPGTGVLQLVAEPFELGPFTCFRTNHCRPCPRRTVRQTHHAIELAGHLHPSLRLTTARERRPALLLAHHRGIVLPSFGSVTGSSPISIDIGESAVVVAGQQLHHLIAG